VPHRISVRRSDAPTPKILCIDDDPAVGQLIRIHLSNYHVKVISAGYGTQGYWDAMVHQPDVVITDLRMPQGSGDYVVECLKRNLTTRGIPVIVLTGRRDPAQQRYLESLGVARYFVKPLPFDQLLTELRRHVTLEPSDAERPPGSQPQAHLS
jgi:DNA-binding response OmpR family regulator